jgi:hypothetical protein
LVIFFVHSTGILCRIGTKHEILVWKSRENRWKKPFNCYPFRSNLKLMFWHLIFNFFQ